MHEQNTLAARVAPCLFYDSFHDVAGSLQKEQTVIVTDEHIAALYGAMFEDYRGIIVIPAGESAKTIDTVSNITQQLIELKAHRNTMLLGVGGGVVTDIAGFAASIYMRGIPFAFVPTTVLGMVDAAIGGKNGVNLGDYKNMLGVIRQPQFIAYHTDWLATLPEKEWSNGFAEVIKYACLFDKPLFEELESNDISFYQQHTQAMRSVIERCVQHKNNIIAQDEHEKSIRKLLNFGHTIGHAIERIYQLSHGEAVAIGMVAACALSEQHATLPHSVRPRLIKLLEKYHLPSYINTDNERVAALLAMDKKRDAEKIDYILLNDIGNAIIHPLSITSIIQVLENKD